MTPIRTNYHKWKERYVKFALICMIRVIRGYLLSPLGSPSWLSNTQKDVGCDLIESLIGQLLSSERLAIKVMVKQRRCALL